MSNTNNRELVKKKLHWYHIKFKLFNGENTTSYRIVAADSLLHYMIANEVCAPVLDKYHMDIVSWRFHRMQTKSMVGEVVPQHSFTFKVYCGIDTFKGIRDRIRKHNLVNVLKSKKLLIRVDFARTDGCSLKDDHDSQWPVELKEIWPFYICGLSQAWLGMVRSYYAKVMIEENTCKGFNEKSFNHKLEIYKEVASSVFSIWRRWGVHSFFHHSNALFGYKWMGVKIPPGRIVAYEYRYSNFVFKFLSKIGLGKLCMKRLDNTVIPNWSYFYIEF